jgi:hypothetical protein
MLSSLKLCSASSNRSALKSLNVDQAVTSDASKQNCPRSMSLSELNLEPDDQGDYICEFFSHSTSHCRVKTQCVKWFWCGKPWPQFLEATSFSTGKKHAGGHLANWAQVQKIDSASLRLQQVNQLQASPTCFSEQDVTDSKKLGDMPFAMWWVTNCRNICCRQFFFASIYRAFISNMLTVETMILLTSFLLHHFNHEQSSHHLTSKAPLDMYVCSHILHINGVMNLAPTLLTRSMFSLFSVYPLGFCEYLCW